MNELNFQFHIGLDLDHIGSSKCEKPSPRLPEFGKPPELLYKHHPLEVTMKRQCSHPSIEAPHLPRQISNFIIFKIEETFSLMLIHYCCLIFLAMNQDLKLSQGSMEKPTFLQIYVQCPKNLHYLKFDTIFLFMARLHLALPLSCISSLQLLIGVSSIHQYANVTIELTIGVWFLLHDPKLHSLGSLCIMWLSS